MNYRQVIENCLKNITSLQKIRVKTDPKFLAANNGPEGSPSYEGYILEEGLSNIKILVMPPDLSIEEIPAELIEYIADEEKTGVFNDLINFIINGLELSEDDPLKQQLANCKCISEVEQFLKQKGLNDAQISKIYGEFILQ